MKIEMNQKIRYHLTFLQIQNGLVMIFPQLFDYWEALYKLITNFSSYMSYKSFFEQKQSIRNRKISFNMMLTYTRDSQEHINSSKSHHSGWVNDFLTSQSPKQQRMSHNEQQYIIEINLYNQCFQIDCSNQQSISSFMNYLEQKVSINKQTKSSLILMIAQKAYHLNVTCGDIFKQALEKYQNIQMINIFN